MTLAGARTAGVRLSVVVPSLTGDVDGVVASIARQSLTPDEVEVVAGVSPSGRARNIGASRTSAPVLVFVDDDARLGDDDTLARLVEPLADPTVGAVGTAKLIPPGSSVFQRCVARQVPRIVHPVVDRLAESTLPLDRLGYTDVTTTCCAVRREVFDGLGGFDEGLVRGVDSEFFYRMAGAGFRLVQAAGTWVHHPAPASIGRLWSKHFRYGTGFAQEVRRHPQLGRGRRLATPVHAAAYAAARTAWVVPHAFLPWSYADPTGPRFGFRPLRALSSYAAALGYVYGWYRASS